jgi:hypothetical protein
MAADTLRVNKEPAVTALLLCLTALAADEKPVAVKLGVLTAEAPADWKREKPANLLRSFQFRLPSGDESLADAELAVYPESSPKVEAKFEEWKGTFIPPDGKTLEQVSKVTRFDLPRGVKAHVLNVSGTWNYRERPKDPRSKRETRPEYRAVWVILVHDDETVHLRLSGPRKVMERQYPAFEKWLKSAK